MKNADKKIVDGFVYLLRHRDGKCYVGRHVVPNGVGFKEEESRYKGSGNWPTNETIRQECEMTVLERFLDIKFSELKTAESYWTDKFRRIYGQLCRNRRSGGGGVAFHSKKSKNKSSKSIQGRRRYVHPDIPGYRLFHPGSEEPGYVLMSSK